MSASKLPPSPMVLVAKHLRDIERTITEAGDHTHPSERTKFGLFLRLTLWSNKIKREPCDSIAALNELVNDLEENLLCDNLSEVWFKIQDIKSKVRSSNSETPVCLDLVTNSSGLEAFLDLSLVHFLTLALCPISLGSSGVKFRIHNKKNVHSILAQMVEAEQDSTLQDLAMTWKSYVDSEFWELHDELTTIPSAAEYLYNSLSASKLILFIGETYYRMLVGDKKWHPLTPFRSTLGDFQPAPLVAIRSIKSDIVAGIEDINIFAKINNNQLPRDWITSGDYGLIQYYDPCK